MSKNFLQSKTVWGAIIHTVNAISLMLGGAPVIETELAENISDSDLNTGD